VPRCRPPPHTVPLANCLGRILPRGPVWSSLAAVLLSLISACAAPVDWVGTRFGNVELIRSQNGGYAVRSGKAIQTLSEFSHAAVVGYWSMQDSSVLAIRAATPSCPEGVYALVTARADRITERRLDTCGTAYRFAELRGALIATDDRGGSYWVLRDGTLSGPHREPRRVRTAVAHRGWGSAPGVSVNPDAEAQADVAAALKPPPVSAPVGNDVIPSQVPTTQGRAVPAIRFPGNN
jgi:hypothetical protein